MALGHGATAKKHHMNKFWDSAIAVALCASFIGGWETRGWKDGVTAAHLEEAQQQNTINAQNHVISVVEKQQTTTQGAENAYHIGIAAIDSLYINNPAINRVPDNGATSPRPKAPICEKVSRKYHLTLKQCDEQEAGYIALWDDWIAQADIK